MKPVDQTTFGHPGGNCFSACVASLLEKPIDTVPYFMADPDTWGQKFEEWLALRGFYPIYALDNGEWTPAGLCILGGQSSRGSHACVGRGRILLHDPHPSREGLITLEDFTMFVPFDPARRR